MGGKLGAGFKEKRTTASGSGAGRRHQSTFGQGAMMPDPAKAKALPDGVKVPLGEAINPPDHQGTSLLYNEFIVYGHPMAGGVGCYLVGG